MNTDVQWMQAAVELAKEAGEAGEVPVGAVVVRDGILVGRGRNGPIGNTDPTAHAEIMALRDAAKTIGNYRLENCTLYVTLEPCTMCSGAIQDINHQTEVAGGVLADECRQLLQQFFKPKRINMNPLRDDALRPPDDWFEDIPDYPWAAHYVSDLPSLNGLRLHYLDEGLLEIPSQVQDASNRQQLTYLCLHGNPAWSYLYRKMIPTFTAHGHRVVAPDLIGFGKSDKLKKATQHNFDFHRQVLLDFIEHLDLKRIVLVVQDWGGILGLTLPMDMPHRFAGLLVMNTALATGTHPLSKGFLSWREWCQANPDFDVAKLFARGNKHMSDAETQAYNSPFKDRGHRAALHAFPPMVPEFENSPGAEISRQALHFWREQWQGQTMMAIGLQDPVLGEPVMRELQQNIKGCPSPLLLSQAGHFVQEHGQSIAESAVQYFKVSTS
ncbi:MAG: tRNA-specific adenosine deaminase [Limnohabitans sp.]|nr:tRNA-specific adenosine deaminase [Limnohabitans sp.]